MITLMPPTRGHDLKLFWCNNLAAYLGMPPTRGHDLKHTSFFNYQTYHVMPPTRGHDLKLACFCVSVRIKADAPHTGARLETCGQDAAGVGCK